MKDQPDKRYLIVLYTALFVTTKRVIPVKAGIQTLSLRKQGTSVWRTGFPRIKYGAGSIKSGMTNSISLMFSCIAFTVLFFMSFFVSSSHAAMNPEEILRKADQSRGNTEGVEWEIVIKSIEGGREQNRSLRVSARSFNSLAEFLAPANVKGQKMLMIDRNMWFVKPGLSKAVPISPRQKLLGGAANGDIASTNYAGDYKVVHAADDTVNREACYLFDLSAVDKKVTYDRIKYWISKERLVGVKAEFYTVSGKMFKTATFEYENSITVDNAPRPFISRMVITNAIVKEDVTTMSFLKVAFKKIPDSMFNLNLLMK